MKFIFTYEIPDNNSCRKCEQRYYENEHFCTLFNEEVPNCVPCNECTNTKIEVLQNELSQIKGEIK